MGGVPRFMAQVIVDGKVMLDSDGPSFTIGDMAKIAQFTTVSPMGRDLGHLSPNVYLGLAERWSRTFRVQSPVGGWAVLTCYVPYGKRDQDGAPRHFQTIVAFRNRVNGEVKMNRVVETVYSKTWGEARQRQVELEQKASEQDRPASDDYVEIALSFLTRHRWLGVIFFLPMAGYLWFRKWQVSRRKCDCPNCTKEREAEE